MKQLLRVLLSNTLVNGAYKDYLNKYKRYDTALSWDAANAKCKEDGLELAPINSEAERKEIMSRISSLQSTYTGVRCKTAGIAHDWSYTGSTYIKSGAGGNPNWCTGEPNSGCSGEQCMHIYTSGCWNDINCSLAYPFICGVATCKREQVIAISTQPTIRISQGETKVVTIVNSSPKYSDFLGTPTCSIDYSCSSDCSTGSSATVSISGTSMTIVATNVNKASVVAANWSVSKTLNVKMADSAVPTTAISLIPIVIVPCEI
jgi:hypothetical protein